MRKASIISTISWWRSLDNFLLSFIPQKEIANEDIKKIKKKKKEKQKEWHKKDA